MMEIDPKNRAPIYEQIMENLRRLIFLGVLKPDEKLPSVRSLAMELAVNPNTVQKAYQTLEERGVIYSLPGKGSFVCGEQKLSHDEINALSHKMFQAMSEAKLLGLSFEKMQKILETVYKNK